MSTLLRSSLSCAAVFGLVVVLGVVAGRSSGRSVAILQPIPPFEVARPAAGRTVPAGADLRQVLRSAPSGSVLLLSAGEYRGPLVIDRPVTLWGPREAVIKSRGAGTTISVTADGAALLGFTVDGSGSRYDLHDAAVRVEATDVRLEGLCIRRALFGILVEKSRRVAIRGNRIYGAEAEALGMRGDSIRLWETTDSVIERNHVTDGRDLVIWYASRNKILRNTVERGRYGTHLMYSHGNLLEGNRYLGNTVGIFVMYSRDVGIRRNLVAGATGQGGMGVGLKESGNLTLTDNLLVKNTIGLFIDTSPMTLGDHNQFTNNVFRLCEVGIRFHGTPRASSFEGNDFSDNQLHVRVDGRGHARSIPWSGNYFGDYQGYDLDRDGVGDVPYELRRLSGQLVGRYPALAFFRGAPVLDLVDSASQISPLFAPRKILADPKPRMAPSVEGALR